MTDKHLSTQFDAELSGVSTRVLEMGGLVEQQVAGAIEALSSFSESHATQVLKTEERVNQIEVDIDRDLNNIIARRQPTARDLRLLIGVSKTLGNLERAGDEAARIRHRLAGIASIVEDDDLNFLASDLLRPELEAGAHGDAERRRRAGCRKRDADLDVRECGRCGGEGRQRQCAKSNS